MVIAITLVSVFCGAVVADALVSYLHIGGWWALLMIPVVLFVSFAVLGFFVLGIKKGGNVYNMNH